ATRAGVSHRTQASRYSWDFRMWRSSANRPQRLGERAPLSRPRLCKGDQTWRSQNLFGISREEVGLYAAKTVAVRIGVKRWRLRTDGGSQTDLTAIDRARSCLIGFMPPFGTRLFAVTRSIESGVRLWHRGSRGSWLGRAFI